MRGYILDTRDWEILKILYEEKNLTRAGQKLFISQPAITYRIRQLEKNFGINILFTEDKNIQFTTEGEQLVEYAEKMLLEEQKLRDTIMNVGSEVKGTLRLGVSNSYAQYKLPSILKGFLEAYPKVKIMLKTGTSSEVINLLFNNEVHIGIENVGYDWEGSKVPMGKEKIVLISKDKIDIKDLPNLSMIKYTKNPFLKNSIENWWQNNFTTSPLINIDVNYSGTCKEMVKNGLGFAIMPEFSIEKHDNLHILQLCDESGKPLQRDNWMNFRKSSLKLSVVSKFVDFITKHSAVEST